MLFDPKWEVQTKIDPLTIEAVIAWLERQPADQVYCYMDRGRCLAAQYNASIGRHYDGCALSLTGDTTFDERLERIAVMKPYTFGAALTRARAAQAAS